MMYRITLHRHNSYTRFQKYKRYNNSIAKIKYSTLKDRITIEKKISPRIKKLIFRAAREKKKKQKRTSIINELNRNTKNDHRKKFGSGDLYIICKSSY